MIADISLWAQNIVIAVIITTIIEMIIPDGNNKKYIRMVMGIFVVFAIVSPVLTKFSSANEFKKSIWDYEQYMGDKELELGNYNTLAQSNENDVEVMYLTSLNSDISERLKEKGYTVVSINSDVELQDEKNYGKIKRIELKVTKNKEEAQKQTNEIAVETISIQTTSTKQNSEQVSNLSGEDINKIQEYISNTYDMNKNNIVIN